MRDLNFRKKRRGRANQKRRRKKKQELKFDTGRPELRFRREKTQAQKQNRGEIANWIVQIIIVCAIAFMLVWFFGQRVSNAGDSMKPVLKNG